MKHHPYDLMVAGKIKKGARFTKGKNFSGQVDSIMIGKSVALQLNPDTCRNAACLPKIIKALNEWSEAK